MSSSDKKIMANGKMQRSKRKSLRFTGYNYSIILKNAFDDARAEIVNISANGCALSGVTIGLELHEKVLLIIPLDEETEVEVGAYVIRMVDDSVAVKFIEIEDEARHRLVVHFAKLQRTYGHVS